MDTLTDLLGRLTELIDSLAALVTDSPVTYLIVFAFTAVDVLFPVIPSEAVVTTAAVLAGQGTLSIVWIMLAAGLGAFVGDNIAYWVGRSAGRPLAKRIMRGRTEQLDTVQAYFRIRGGLLIIVGRFIPGGRTAVAVGAGILHFRWTHFLVYDAVAAVLWSFIAVVPGYVGGVVVQDKPWLALLLGFALSILVAGSLAILQRWWVRTRLEPARVEQDAPLDDPPARAVESASTADD